MPEYSKVVSRSERYVRYYYNRVDLDDDGTPEAIVYLVGSYTCGTGGCTAVIFTPTGQDYRLVSRLSLVQVAGKGVRKSTSDRAQTTAGQKFWNH